MLHLAAFDLSQPSLMAMLLECVNAGDAVVFLDDGLAWLARPMAIACLQERGVSLYALQENAPPAPVAALDAAGLVALSDQHPSSSSWHV